MNGFTIDFISAPVSVQTTPGNTAAFETSSRVIFACP